jgi:hypothetical protein
MRKIHIHLNYPMHHPGKTTLIRQLFEHGFFPFPAVRVRMTVQILEQRPEAGVEGLRITKCCVRSRRGMIGDNQEQGDINP